MKLGRGRVKAIMQNDVLGKTPYSDLTSLSLSSRSVKFRYG